MVRLAVQSTLENLSERLTLDEAEDLTAHLTGKKGTWLVDCDSPKAAYFSAEGFIGRVANRGDIVTDTSRKHVQQVANGLGSFAPAEAQRAREQFGPDHSSIIQHI